MKLKEIEINKYKSITSPVKIEIDGEDKFFAFIGKNGSGKTNVLQAIKNSLVKNNYYGDGRDPLSAKYRFTIREEEKTIYSSTIDMEIKDETISVLFNNQEPNVKKIEVPDLKVCVSEFKKKIEDAALRVKESSNRYIEKLRTIETSYNESRYIDINVKEGTRGSVTVLTQNVVESLQNQLENAVKQINDYLQETFEGEYVSIDSRSLRPFYCQPYFSLYQLEEISLSISPIVAKSLGIESEDAIKKANNNLKEEIHKINKQLKSEYVEINNAVEDFKETEREFEKFFTKKEAQQYEKVQEEEKMQTNFLALLNDCAFNVGYYIDNENALLFGDNPNRYHDQQEYVRQNLNNTNPILEAIDRFLSRKHYYRDDESIFKLKDIEESRLNKLLDKINKEFLNRIIPNFDKMEIEGFSLEFDNDRLVFYVKEKNGNKTDFNKTSLGRRWYLTYAFVKKLLKPGEYLFIDEPAAFLHPQAQSEFKEDLHKLAEKGVYVFITTHSPYMIPENWHNVYNVIMTEEGTKVVRFSNEDGTCKCIKEELGVLVINSILFQLSKTILFVEGTTDKICIEKLAELLNYSLDDYIIHVCDGDSILQLSYLCIKENIKFISLLDNDNKYKNSLYIKGHSQYNVILPEITGNTEKCFFVGEGKKGCLESLFIEEDNKYSEKNEKGIWKIKSEKINKIKNKNELNEKTLDNFKKLFDKIGISKKTEEE